jgi:hypothetical protein
LSFPIDCGCPRAYYAHQSFMDRNRLLTRLIR